jgi:hypothetical protein
VLVGVGAFIVLVALLSLVATFEQARRASVHGDATRWTAC